MTTCEIIALRDRLEATRANTPIGDVVMGEVLTDGVDNLTAWSNERTLREIALLDGVPEGCDFHDYWTEQFSLAGSC